MSLTTSQIIADHGIRRAVQEEISMGAKWSDIVVALRLSLGRAEYAVRKQELAAAQGGMIMDCQEAFIPQDHERAMRAMRAERRAERMLAAMRSDGLCPTQDANPIDLSGQEAVR